MSYIDIMEFCAYAWKQLAKAINNGNGGSRHGLDVGMRDGIELLISELVIRANIDVSSSILGRVAILRGREN